MKDYIQLRKFPVKDMLKLLLTDKTTGKNITFATNSYADYGINFAEDSYITETEILGIAECEIQPRICKAIEQQAIRTKNKAEVFTPSWICNRMNNFCDEEWFGEKNIFNGENGTKWTANPEKIRFVEKNTWQKYVDLRFLEITCGECPYLVSRYDTSTGDEIPISERIGILDRKLRVVGENTDNEEEWLKWVTRAYQSTYGYEYQGDSLLIARINLLMTFCDYMQDKWNRKPKISELNKIVNIISWNIFQMNGINGNLPIYGLDNYEQMTIFSLTEEEPQKEEIPCYIYNWRVKEKIKFNDTKEGRKMKFDFVIGNPPYQDETIGDNATYAPPVYHLFINSAYEVGEKVELITPARFLFNAGSTPKAWNKQMLEDEHLKILHYEQKSDKIFSNTDIKGGVCISYHDKTKNFGAIQTFTPYELLRTSSDRVSKISSQSLSEIIYTQNRFSLEELYRDYPNLKNSIGSDGKDKRFRNNIFDKIPLFLSELNSNDDIAVIGVINNKRVWRYIAQKYVDTVHENLFKYKVIVPRANGRGALSDVLSSPVVISPNQGYTQTFIGIGAFDTKNEAENCLKYIKTKFARAMLNVLKVDQHNEKDTWKKVPLQDFTAQSDIDWTKSVADIDRQLYQKYGLTQQEIDFIETKVKEMN